MSWGLDRILAATVFVVLVPVLGFALVRIVTARARTRRAWEAFARGMPGLAGPTDDDEGLMVAGELGGIPCVARLHGSTGRRDGNLDTEVVAGCRRALPDGLRLRPQRLLFPVERALGAKDLQVGDPAFDRAFVIQSADEAGTHALLADGTLRRNLLTQLAREPRVLVKDGAVIVSRKGIVREPTLLRGMFEAAISAATALDQAAERSGRPVAATPSPELGGGSGIHRERYWGLSPWWALLGVFAVGMYVFMQLVLPASGWHEAGQRRLAEAREARSGERLLEGRIRVVDEPLHTRFGNPAVAVVRWQRTRSGSEHHRHHDHSFAMVPFDLETDDGVFRVDGDLAGVTELERRVRGATLSLEASVGPGDRVSVLGVVSERDGRPGFYDEVFIARGTYREWHDFLKKETPPSFRSSAWR